MAVKRIRKPRAEGSLSRLNYAKPPFGTALDYNNPLTEGLLAGWLLNEGKGDLTALPTRLNEIHGFHNLDAVVGTNSLWRVNPVTMAQSLGAAVGVGTVMVLENGITGTHIPVWDFSSGLTVEVRLAGVNGSTSVQGNFVSYGDSTNNQKVFSLWSALSTGNILWTVSSNGTAGTQISVNASGSFVTYFGIWRPTLSVMELWGSINSGGTRFSQNAFPLGTTAFTGPPFIPTLPNGQRLSFGTDAGGFGGGGGSHEGAYEFVGIWNRALSQDEMQERILNPWGIMQPGYYYNTSSALHCTSLYQEVEYINVPLPVPPIPPVQPDLANLYGNVTDSVTGNPIVGATVTLDSMTTTTDASGFYQFLNATLGAHTATASAVNYTSQSVSVSLASGNNTLNFALDPIIPPPFPPQPPPVPPPPPGPIPNAKKFRLFKKDTEIRVKQWGSGDSYTIVHPFGGDSFDDGAKI